MLRLRPHWRSSRRRAGHPRANLSPAPVERIEPRVLLSGDVGPAGFFDPDNTIDSANYINVNSTASDEVDVSGDVDMYEFDATPGQTLTFDTDGVLDSVLRLFNASGVQIAYSDDNPAPGESANTLGSYITRSFPSGGRYYIGVSGYGNDGYDPFTGSNVADSEIGPYSLVVLSSGGGGVNPADADDQISEARTVTIGGNSADQISVSGDVDMYSVTVATGQTLEFDTDSTDNLDTILRIFSADGTQIAYSDDDPAPGEPDGVQSYVRHSFAAAGTYYVGVSGYENDGYDAIAGTGDVASEIGAYTLFVREIVVPASSISGTVWNDADGSRTRGTGEAVLSGWTVYLDTNNNGAPDAGEPTETTNASGGYTFSGVAPGQYVVRQVVQTGWEQTYPAPAAPSEFSIEVNFTDSNMTASQQAAFTSAARRWAQIITGDVPDMEGIDDLRIDASAPYIDGPSGVLGQAGPSRVRPGSNLPLQGVMEFDSADVAALERSGQLVDVILHEMGHVLGIGTLWDTLGLITGGGTGNPIFTGAGALLEYNGIFSGVFLDTPVENTGGSGTADGHWRETIFDNELMTGYLNTPGPNPLSRITVASLADMGYTVNLGAADLYTRPAPPPASVADASSKPVAGKGVTGRMVALDLPLTVADPTLSPVPAATGDAGVQAAGDPGHNVTITGGQTITGMDFGNRQAVAQARVSGYVTKAGADDQVWGWAAVPPTGISVRRGAGANGSDRVTLTWADGAIRGKWLQVSVQPNERTGLATADTFYFGNLPGETGNDPSAAATSPVDYVTTRNIRLPLGAGIGHANDFNRDGRVNVLDLHFARAFIGKSIPLLYGPSGPPPEGTFADTIVAPPPGESLEVRRAWDESAADVLG